LSDLPAIISPINDDRLVILAREIAKDMHPLETILEVNKIGVDQWETIQNNPRFQRLLESEIADWNSASNASERVRLKSIHFVEEVLPEFYARANDPRESLAAKTEVLKTVARFAGIGSSGGEIGGAGEKFTVTINLGADKSLKIEKTVTPQVIEGHAEAVDASN